MFHQANKLEAFLLQVPRLKAYGLFHYLWFLSLRSCRFLQPILASIFEPSYNLDYNSTHISKHETYKQFQKILTGNKPAMIARLGASEGMVLINYFYVSAKLGWVQKINKAILSHYNRFELYEK